MCVLQEKTHERRRKLEQPFHVKRHIHNEAEGQSRLGEGPFHTQLKSQQFPCPHL